MTINYHTPLSFGSALTSENFNQVLSQLDSGITSIASQVTGFQDEIDDLIDGTTAFTNIDVDGGFIENTIIGQSNQQSGAFTSLSATALTVTNSSNANATVTSTTLASNINIRGNTSGNLNISGGTGQNQNIRFQTENSNRWVLVSNNASESGGNAGSNFNIYAYDDSGSFLGTYVTITRSNGAVALSGALGINGKAPAAPQTWGLPTGNINRSTFDTTSVNVSQLASRVNALIVDLSATGIINAS